MATSAEFSAAEEIEFEGMEIPVESKTLEITFFGKKSDVLFRYLKPTEARQMFNDGIAEITSQMPTILEGISPNTPLKVARPATHNLLFVEKLYHELTELCATQVLQKIADGKSAHFNIISIIKELATRAKQINDITYLDGVNAQINAINTVEKRENFLATYQNKYKSIFAKITTFGKLVLDAVDAEEVKYKKFLVWKNQKPQRKQIGGAPQKLALDAPTYKCEVCETVNCKTHCKHCQFGNCNGKGDYIHKKKATN